MSDVKKTLEVTKELAEEILTKSGNGKEEETKEENVENVEEQVEEQSKEQEEVSSQTEEEKKEIIQDELDEILEKGEDGKYRIEVNGTEYVGTKKEIIQKILEDYKQKDITAKSFKNKLAVKNVLPKQEEDDIKPPDRDAILEKILREEGVPREMLSWNAEQWNEYVDKVGLLNASDMRQKVRDVEKRYASVMQEENLKYYNLQMIREGSEEVAELFAEHGLEIDDKVLENIIADVYDDEKCWNSGRIRAGAIVRKAAKYLDTKRKSAVKKEVINSLAVAREKTKGAAFAKQPAPVQQKPQIKSLDDAATLLLKQFSKK